MNEDKVSGFCERIMYAKKWMPSPIWIIIGALMDSVNLLTMVINQENYSIEGFPEFLADFTDSTIVLTFLWLIIFVIIMQKKDR